MHTSGALASDVLEPLRNAGFAAGSLHPLVSISESRSGAELLTGAFFSVEGDPAAVRVGRSIVSDLGGESFKIDSRHKALYHAAAVTASPNTTALFDIALNTDSPLQMICTPELAALYGRALGAYDVKSAVIDGDRAALAGLVHAHAEIFS